MLHVPAEAEGWSPVVEADKATFAGGTAGTSYQNESKPMRTCKDRDQRFFGKGT